MTASPLGPGRSERDLRRQICAIGRLMHRKGFIAAGDGNLSCRLPGGGGRLLVTPTGLHKGFMAPEQMVVIDLEGNRLYGRGAPSSEIRVHLAVYAERPDVGAVIHAHPPRAIACSLAGVSLAQSYLPEVIYSLGSIPTAPYATPGTDDLAASIRPAVRAFNAVVMARHGSVTCGDGLWEAYMFLERLEHSAEITWAARALGFVEPLPREEACRLIASGASRGHRTAGAREVYACDLPAPDALFSDPHAAARAAAPPRGVPTHSRPAAPVAPAAVGAVEKGADEGGGGGEDAGLLRARIREEVRRALESA